jgi:cytochrome P450
LSNGILAFSENPAQVELFRRHPERLRLSAEECLRYHSPFRLGRRIATENVTIAGLDVKEGENLVFARQAINRDPMRFENPDVFDIMRPERRNFSFAYGPHFCLGQAVARTNVQIALSVFLNRFGDFQIVSPPERVPFVPEEQIRNLRITFRPLQ